MQLHHPDPSSTDPEWARARFRRSLQIAAAFVVLLWVIQVANWAFDLDLARFGVRPRVPAGLVGILSAPLLHGGFGHLIANSLPLLVLGTFMLYLYRESVAIVLPAAYLGPGVAVWLFGRDSIHVGASGLIYGVVTYIFVGGVLRRDRRAIAASLLVAFMYGSLAWGLLPVEPGISWETHLAAALIGLALAIGLRRRDVPPRRRYDWEDNEQ